MADNSIVPPSAPDVISNTQDWVVGVIDTPADAERATQDLRNAGFAENEVVLLHGPDAVQAFQDRETHQGALRTFLAHLIGETNDVSGFANDYQDEARMGHSIVSVYAPQAEDIAQAQQILEAHGGHRMKHYGQWTVNQLSMQDRDRHEPQAAAGLQAAADNVQATQPTERGMAADQRMAPSTPGAASTSATPNTTGGQTGWAEPSNTQAHMTSQPNTTNTTNTQTGMPNTVESASGWQDMPMTSADESDDNQYPGEGI